MRRRTAGRALALLGGIALLLCFDGLGRILPGTPPAARAVPGVLGLSLLLAAALSERAARRALVSVLALGVTLGLAEAVARWRVGPRVAALFVADRALLHRQAPGGLRIVDAPPGAAGGPVRIEINAEGFRGPPLRAAARRVVVHGDSFVAGWGVPHEQTLVSRLGAALTAQLGVEVEAINAGVPGYGPDQSLMSMEEVLPRLRPDLVVLCLYPGNDYGDLVRNKLLSLDATGRVRRASPTLSPRLLASLEYGRRAPTLLKALTTLGGPIEEDPSALDADAMLMRCQEEFLAGGGLVVDNLFWDGHDADVALTPESASARAKRALMRGALTLAAGAASRAGVPLLVVAIPARFDVAHPAGGLVVDPERFPAYRPENLTAFAAEDARASGLPCVDLFGALAGPASLALYFEGHDLHLNAAGHDAAARAVAARILGDRLLR